MGKAFECFLVVLFCSAALFLVSLVAYPVFKSISAEGKVEYCYVDLERYNVPIQPNVVVYHLYGFRPWRADRHLAANLKSLEEAKAEADRLGCPLR